MKLLLFTYLNLVSSNVQESNLRKTLFENYNTMVRPVENYNDKLNVSMGLGVQNLEAFNQKEETIDINLWVRLNWNDAYLNWNTTTSNLTFLSVDKSYTWVPDIELLNAASLPDVYNNPGFESCFSCLYLSSSFFSLDNCVYISSCFCLMRGSCSGGS